MTLTARYGHILLAPYSSVEITVITMKTAGYQVGYCFCENTLLLLKFGVFTSVSTGVVAKVDKADVQKCWRIKLNLAAWLDITMDKFLSLHLYTLPV